MSAKKLFGEVNRNLKRSNERKKDWPKSSGNSKSVKVA